MRARVPATFLASWHGFRRVSLQRLDRLARDLRGGRYLRRVRQLLSRGRAPREIDSVLRGKGLKTFFDRHNLAPGLPWVRALEQAIGAAKAAIVLIGPRGLENT
jgi:hypothetical protein